MPRVSSDVTPRRCSVPRARARWALVAGSNRTAEGSSEGRSAPKWWDVGGRLNDAVQRDQRSEHGYLEHESTPVVLFDKRSNFNGRVRVVAHGPWRSLPASTTSSRVSRTSTGTGATQKPRASHGRTTGGRATGAEMDPRGARSVRGTASGHRGARLLLPPDDGGGGGGGAGSTRTSISPSAAGGW